MMKTEKVESREDQTQEWGVRRGEVGVGERASTQCQGCGEMRTEDS